MPKDDPYLAKLVAELTKWDKDLAPLRETWLEMWKAWTPSAPSKFRPKDPRNPFISNVRVPWGFHAVETILPRVVGFDPRMRYRALDDKDDVPIALLMGGLTTAQMQKMGFELEARDFLRQGLIVGYTVGKLGWWRVVVDQEFPTVNREYDDTLQASFAVPGVETRQLVLQNEPFFETVDVANGDFVWPLLARDLDSAPRVWQRKWTTKKQMRDAGVYDKLDEVTFDASTRYRDSRRDRLEQQNVEISAATEELDESEIIVELWEGWSDETLCAIANPFSQPVKVREEDNPFEHGRKPFVDWAPIPDPFQMHGIGVIQTVFDQNEDLNTLRRQRRDALSYLLNPAWKSTGGLPGNQLQLFPGKLFNLEELEDIEPMTQPVVDLGASFQEEAGIKQDMKDTTGAYDSVAGQASPGEQTATEIATLSNEGNKRIAEMVKVFEKRTMTRYGALLQLMDIQFVDVETAIDFSDDPLAAEAWLALAQTSEAIKELGKEYDPNEGVVPLTPDMLSLRGRLLPMPNVGQDKLANDIQERSDATQVVQALAPFLTNPASMMLFNWRGLVGWVLERFRVPKEQREAILQADPAQIQAYLASVAAEKGGQNGDSGESGPSGENAPTGAVVGAPGAAGPAGPPMGLA